MGPDDTLLWFSPAVLILAVAWIWLKRATSRPMAPPPRKRFPRAEQLRWEQLPDPAAPPPGMPPAHAAFIRRDAEEAARRVLAAGGPEAPNPYPRGTRECVLWTTSFHLAMAEHAERQAPPSPAPP